MASNVATDVQTSFAPPMIDHAVQRLSALAPLDAGEIEALHDMVRLRYPVAAHREFVSEGEPIVEPTIVMSGWACRVRFFSDGRRQILSFLLPGELIGVCHHPAPLAATSIAALTPVTLCPAPKPAHRGTGLDAAYSSSRALEELYLFRHIARLGRMSAYDRMIDWLLETRDRLALAGLASEDSFALPLTQEGIADTLGLTAVHVNRTLQAMRREGLIELRGGTVRLFDPVRLRMLVDYRPVAVSHVEPCAA